LNASIRRMGASLSFRFRGVSVGQLLILAPVIAILISSIWIGLYYLAGDFVTERRRLVQVVAGDVHIAGWAWLAVALIWIKYHHRIGLAARLAERPGDATAFKAALWSLTAWLALLSIPAWVAMSRNSFRDVVWIGWEFNDYRWLPAAYLVTIFSIIALPPIFARLLEAAQPPRLSPRGAVPRTRGRSVIAPACAVVLCVVLFAPPWNIEHGVGELGAHDVHLSQIQAIHKGSLPYIGPASIQYGPGSQLLQYVYMEQSGKFSFAGYRETYAVMALLGFGVFSVLACVLLGVGWGIVASVLALYLSPFWMFHWNGTVFEGFFGWANPFRYLGALLVLALLPKLVSEGDGWRNYRALLTGLLWGFFTWMSQENLAITAMSAGLFLVVAWALRCCTAKQALTASGNAVVGLLLFWLPVLVYYAAKGALPQFTRNYVFVARQVAAGLSNTPWDPDYNLGWSAAFYLTPCFLVVVVWITIFDFAKRQFIVPLPPERERLLALLCLTLVCYTGALFRKDASHLINVLIGVPLVVAAWAAEICRPKFTGRRMLALLIGPVLFVCLFPTAAQIARFPEQFVIEPAKRFWSRNDGQPSAWAADEGIAFRRAGDFLSSNYLIYPRAMPARVFLETMGEVRTIVGDRPVFVHSFPSVPPEIVYFFADLRPGPILLNVMTMIFNSRTQELFLEHMERHCREFQALVGSDPAAREVQIFKRCHPDATQVEKKIAGSPYFVLLSKDVTAAQ
jgi:hypothetical protein